LLRPEEQLTKLGSIGRECLGTARIKLRDPDGAEVADGEVVEIYSLTPYAFQGYWKSPAKTVAPFRGEYCSVCDLARRDPDVFYFLAECKSKHDHQRRRECVSLRDPSLGGNLLGSTRV
jgi:fatty-acyl-CoA synthase